MKRQWLATAAAVVVLSCGLAACSGSSDDKPDAAPAKTSSAPASTPTPAPAPTTPPQPQGANGVTYEIQNWDQYATDPAVLAWKQTQEAIAASANQGKVLEPMRAGLSKRALRDYVESIQQAWDGDWHVEATGKVRIESASTTGDRATFVACLWAPTTAFLRKNGLAVGADTAKDAEVWQKQNVQMAMRDGRWLITKFEYDGECSGGAPG
jgi:hypothetical protein